VPIPEYLDAVKMVEEWKSMEKGIDPDETDYRE